MNRILEMDVFMEVLEDEGLDETLDRGIRTDVESVDMLLDAADQIREGLHALKLAIFEAALPYAEGRR